MEEYGYAPDFDDSGDDWTQWISTEKSLHGGKAFDFSVSDAAEVETHFVVEFLCETQALDEDELWNAIEMVAEPLAE